MGAYDDNLENPDFPIGLFDPDEDDANPRVRPGWSKPKTELQRSALASCNRRWFKSSGERREWNALEQKALGGTQESIMHQEWIKHNIQLCVTANSRRPERSFTILIKMIQNEDRKVDWIVANRDKVLAARSTAIKSIFDRKKDDDE